jgi:hypothetical protein
MAEFLGGSALSLANVIAPHLRHVTLVPIYDSGGLIQMQGRRAARRQKNWKRSGAPQFPAVWRWAAKPRRESAEKAGGQSKTYGRSTGIPSTHARNDASHHRPI